MASDEAFQQLKEMAREPAERVRNEADTRHKVIDFILHNILAWPTNRVSVEEYIRPGYADYVLKRTNDDPIILVEAKKEGRFFELPAPHDPTETCAYISLDKLMSDVTIKDAVTQVRQYCIDVGCEYAAITNGYEWVLFKTFEPSRRWELTKAFVIRRLLFFEVEFTRAFNALSYAAISERSSLSSLLTSNPPKDRSIYYPKEKVPSYSHPVTANRLASHLRPLVNQYFGVNRLDHYSDDVDSIKITPYGMYMLNDLAYYFTYLDLICMDCGVFDEGVSNFLTSAAKQEYDLFINRKRLDRVYVRLGRVERFIDYLYAEEMREKEAYSLSMPEEETFTFRLRDAFNFEKKKVITSATRPRNR